VKLFLIDRLAGNIHRHNNMGLFIYSDLDIVADVAPLIVHLHHSGIGIGCIDGTVLLNMLLQRMILCDVNPTGLLERRVRIAEDRGYKSYWVFLRCN
jgi:hypothetical protein